MLAIFIFLFSLHSVVLNGQRVRDFERLNLPVGTNGPYSVAFGLSPLEFFVVVSDGRILKCNLRTKDFQNFAITAPTRSPALCDGTSNRTLGSTCGRPLGLGFYIKKKILYLTDLYRGFLVVGSNGGLATQLATSAEGVPFRLPGGLDVDQLTGDVYFTDTTLPPTLLNRPLEETLDRLPPNLTGRLLRYDPQTNKVTVLLKGLKGATGVALSGDRRYVVISEHSANRILKFYLRGPKAGQKEQFAFVGGRPLIIERDGATFWVAVRNVLLGTPPPARLISPSAVQIDLKGRVIKTVDLSPFYPNSTVSQFQQRIKYYVGSTDATFVGILKSVF